MKSPAWLAGYNAGYGDRECIVSAIEPPAGYTDQQRGDYVAGYCVGARDARSDRIIDEMATPTEEQ